MNRLAKTLVNWPVQELEIVKFEADASQPAAWQHYMTRCHRQVKDLGQRSGSTIWVNSASDFQAAIAWEWVEVMQGVLALADPNALISNIHFVGPIRQLKRLDAKRRKVLLLNTIVHGLNWQDRVLAELSCSRQPVGTSMLSSALH